MSKYLVTIPVDQSPKKARIGLKIDAPIQAFADDYNRAAELARNYLSLRPVPSEATIYELVRQPIATVVSYKEDKEVKFTVKELNSDGRVSPVSPVSQSEAPKTNEAD